MTRRVSSGLARVMNSVIVTPGELADRRSPQPAAFRDRPHPHTGSPPRAWGAHRSGRRHAPRQRLTPTGVGSTRGPAAGLRGIAAHPHGRGEHSPGSGVGLSLAGSPPRAWGALDHLRWERLRARLTPTGVGSTRPARSWPARTAAHPHGRGEHSTTCAGNGCASGSPPRAWGARHHHRPQGRRPRLTPTGVGSTSPARSWPARTAAHPHGRGEHDPAPPGTHRLGGSPPRAWGARSLGLALGSGQRLTPTGVGSTTPPPVRAPTGTAHPHGRGEHALVALRRCGGRGSPPRAWGAQLLGELLRGPGRLTPTGVGSTGPDARRTRRCTAHPHGRGEHVFTATATGSHTGSPPRAWGAHRVLLRAGLRLRLTPTGVGSTGTCTATRSPRPAHPHGRGEHFEPARVSAPVFGSPPRAWGARRAWSAAGSVVRLTPTGVGSTLLEQEIYWGGYALRSAPGLSSSFAGACVGFWPGARNFTSVNPSKSTVSRRRSPAVRSP